MQNENNLLTFVVKKILGNNVAVIGCLPQRNWLNRYPDKSIRFIICIEGLVLIDLKDKMIHIKI